MAASVSTSLWSVEHLQSAEHFSYKLIALQAFFILQVHCTDLSYIIPVDWLYYLWISWQDRHRCNAPSRSHGMSAVVKGGSGANQIDVRWPIFRSTPHSTQQSQISFNYSPRSSSFPLCTKNHQQVKPQQAQLWHFPRMKLSPIRSLPPKL